tara:strand:+ start:289 stop:1065 length:777 start_codon:yes stop_codon:yes gene_type:complete
MSKRIVVIPDSQIRPGDDYEFLSHIGQYIVDMQPDIIVHLGDFADMPSLSSHDKPGSKSMEGKRYIADVLATTEAMDVLLEPILTMQEQQRVNKKKVWKPRRVMLGGNHEHRINRAVANDTKLEGLISLDDLEYEKKGWEFVPFLEPINIEGIMFCHYFVSGVMGRPCGTARAILAKKHQSCIAGHQQGRDIAFGRRGDGTEMACMIVGSGYEHDEEYLNPQTNNHWRGIVVLNEVVDGQFDEIMVSLRYLRSKYEKR